MTFLHTHKTVIVLDRSPQFLKCSNEPMEFDVFTKSRAPGFIPLAPVTKTMWTCSVEAVLEFARIIYDIYPTDKLIRLVTSDTDAKKLNGWNTTEQNLQHMTVGLAQGGIPDRKIDTDDCNVMHGLNAAIEALCELTAAQQEYIASSEDQNVTIANRGRIIVVTAANSDSHVKMLEECVLDALGQQNKLAAATDNLMPVTHCEFVLVHVTPVGTTSVVSPHQKVSMSSFLSSEVYITQSGQRVANKLVEVAISHYGLSSTTVTGIPMKEEQNASSSANYDVELLHMSAAHSDILKSGMTEGIIVPSKEGLLTMTVTLKWCTPKSNVVELQHCPGAFRISPVDVNSRPSSCLTNFLLNGRAVMLEQPRKSGSKVMSHMLASHGGEIFLHVLHTARTMLEDPPSISEGCGGRVTDYRINDFGELMKESRLAPVPEGTNLSTVPIERAKTNLERITRYWPMVSRDTVIYNMPSHVDPLASLIVKENITEDEMLECKKAIYHLVGMESRNESLPIPAVGARGKGPKREEQYRQMWVELEKLIGGHSSNSSNHQKVMECLLECKRPTESSGSPTKKAAEKPLVPESEAEQAWKQFDSYTKMSEREKGHLNAPIPDTPESPPAKRSRPTVNFFQSNSENLLSMWTSRLSKLQANKHRDFSGRAESSGSRAALYIHLQEDEGEKPQENTNRQTHNGRSTPNSNINHFSKK